MNIFETIKSEITTPDVAERYGINVGRNGFINCIFHNDKHPSMKLYSDHYHCFACGAHGDAVAFTARLFGLTQYEAAKRLAADFNILNVSPKWRVFTEDKARTMLKDCISALERNRDVYRPASPDEEFHPLYVEAVKTLPLYQYYLDILTNGSREEREKFINEERRFFYELKEKQRRSGMAAA